MPSDTLESLSRIDGVALDQRSFADLTTLHIGGRPRATISCQTSDSVVAVVSLLDAHHIPFLIVGGGSNLVVADGELPIVAVVVESDTVRIDKETGQLYAEAGACFDDVVAKSIAAGLGGLECLSGVPGSTGATPVQNVGAYGVEIADILSGVELYDRITGIREWVSAESLELSYRYSNLKFTSRAVVLAITVQLRTDGLSAPVRFGELARQLGIEESEEEPRRPAHLVRSAVLTLRARKGMVYNEKDFDTWSAGSFFTNPIVDEQQLRVVRQVLGDEAQAMPCFPHGDTHYKLSAAWLIERAGFSKGYPGTGPARLSDKHTLALTNRGDAKAADIVALARDIQAGVEETFGVILEPEPIWVGI
ncbi:MULTISPECIES: UDP-N-acetylmuramate dehydrogenase [unclassified Corynebacterium]|uniref:UDP-N-acetylmuramate dehydrogenase n=1 Tax=unclassified Corynebacterium TaxID=2624378 RepID=UPI00216831F6|nr:MULTISPECIES: UDP-N-acetylmuramate dehydrogenase [unclassified Corynebacterium]MCS4489738.1 UDP-N-acetylmuramate dehydrogenase [Corynebacterium sp. ES2775-CONJ]MCS4491253.1 UDP-N-acetylmuramate dehydrogenase [Corynebacterium sp. ES2715-CONJ3]